jgi:hypothetical protein
MERRHGMHAPGVRVVEGVIMIGILDLAEHRGACRWTLFAAALMLMLLERFQCCRS